MQANPYITECVRPQRLKAAVAGGLLLLLIVTSRAGEAAAQTFATSEEAVAALAAAVKGQDREAIRRIFGPAAEEVTNPDRVQATNEFVTFTTAFEQGHRLVSRGPGQRLLEVGTNFWPFPIPLLEQQGRWVFDLPGGKEELWNRRIGRNELTALERVRAYVDAQREYASRDRDGDEVLEFAQRIASTPGRTDGLYWPIELNGEESPLGPLMAEAQAEGYFDKLAASAPQPFHGYLFKILVRQGRHAPGGKYDYTMNGNMIGGFALVAWPAEYGESGVMTLIVNQQGRVYQQDLGRNTARIVTRMNAYDPDPAWRLSPD